MPRTTPLGLLPLVSLAALAPLSTLALTACGDDAPPPKTAPTPVQSVALPPTAPTTPPPAPPPARTAKALSGLSRADFNRLASELFVPLYWTLDKNGNGTFEPDEAAVVWGVGASATSYDKVPAEWVKDGAFQEKAIAAFEAAQKRAGDKPGDDAEGKRRALVIKELAQGRPTLVETDLRAFSPSEKQFVGHVLEAAKLIEQLFQKQRGTFALRGDVPAADTASQMLFFRTQGPKCEAPLTQNDPACSAIPSAPKGKLSGLYPQDLVATEGFCDALGKEADKKLMDPFTVVRKKDGKLTAVPYTEEYKAEMSAVSATLKAAAESVTDPKEGALKTYLLAAAQAFVTNDWVPADEAWAKMGVDNSKWYLRIGPDETYDEPCNTKALFHVSFALINQKSLFWQKKLDPLKTSMEEELAKLAGAPYKARAVSFKLPDFIDVTLNAGDSRAAFGATIGQSLPNFGPVANEGRGRTVAMTSFYTDPDSIASLKETSESLLCKDTMAIYTTDPAPQLMSTVLHEAAHNLGPAHQYKVGGKIDREVFGGPLASTFEELKAQTAALYFTDWLVAKKEIGQADADKAHVRDLVWSFGHISRGMYTETGQPKSYSQLASIQLMHLVKEGAVEWRAAEMATNGKDKGCFAVNVKKFPAATKKLMTEVAGIKGRGDKKSAEALVAKYVDCGKKGPKPDALCTTAQETIKERVLRAPKPSFFYAIRFE